MPLAVFGEGNFLVELQAAGAEGMAVVEALAAARTGSPLFRESNEGGGFPGGNGDLQADVGAESYFTKHNIKFDASICLGTRCSGML